MNHAAQHTTRNPGWGFCGAMREQGEAAWPLALEAITRATGCDMAAVRAFLDSRHGRHFADDLQGGLHRGQSLAHAIDAATRRWMGWTIGHQTSKEYGIPRSLPYLTGFVLHCGICEEIAA